MKSSEPVDRFLERLEPPFLPADLKARSIAAARMAMARPEVRRDIWTRLWESRTARLAWAAAMTALILGHVALSLPSHRPHGPATPAAYLAATTMDPELRETVTLPRLRPGLLPELDNPPAPGSKSQARATSPRRHDHAV